MIAFDIPTAFLFLGALYLILPTIVWVVLVGERSLKVALWCGGGLLAGSALVLTGLTGSIPEWASLSISAMILQISHLLRIQSLRLDLGIPWAWRWIALFAAVIFLIFQGLHLGLQDQVLRAQFNSFVSAVLLFHLAALAWRIGREEQSPSAKWIGGVYSAVAVSLLFRVLSLAAGSGGGDPNVVNEGFSMRLLAPIVLLSSVIGHFGYVGLALDRSRRRELRAAVERARDEENRRLSDHIAQLDRQRSLGELSASLAHELNQPLTAVLTNAQVAKRGLETGRFEAIQHVEFLDKIVYNTQRASQIIERIRGFIRPSEPRSVTVNLNSLVLEVAELVADEALSHEIRFVFPDNERPVLVLGDPIQLSQIVLNAFRNAIEALAQTKRGEIRVSCSIEEGRAVLRIRDSGPGLTAEAMAQAGTPFFTTKPSGLGMGLSISRSIAAQQGGTLTLANAVDGNGAVVELKLPSLPKDAP